MTSRRFGLTIDRSKGTVVPSGDTSVTGHRSAQVTARARRAEFTQKQPHLVSGNPRRSEVEIRIKQSVVAKAVSTAAGGTAANNDLTVGIAAEALGGHRAVYRSAAGFRYAGSDQPTTADAVVGITTGSATPGGEVTVRTDGVMIEPSWTWTPEEPVFLGLNGLITQTAPATGVVVELGVALTTTSILVRVQKAIYLA